MDSLFKATTENPFHVSVGAIIRDGERNYVMIQNKDKFSFMCGTIENNESPEQALRRELFEEMGAFGHIKRFAGASLINATVDKGADFPFQKCILWFDIELSSINPSDATDPQGVIVLVDMEMMKTVNKDYGRWPHGVLE